MAKRPTAASEIQSLRDAVSAQQQQIQLLRDELQKRDSELQQMQQQINSLQSTTQQAQSTAQSAASSSKENEAALAALKTNVATVSTKATETATSFQAYKKLPPVAGWNGSHFFIQSPDKKFEIAPFGYLQEDYHAYAQGPDTPQNYFQLRRARVGFTGHYGKHYTFGFLMDWGQSGLAKTISGPPLRDYYMNVMVVPEAQIKFGQWILPFSQEANHASSDLQFVERSILMNIVPSTGTFRAPGIAFRGEALDKRVYYDLGAFDGKGVLTASTTSTPQGVFRLGFRPFRTVKGHVLEGLDVYGAVSLGKAKASDANEITVSGLVQNRAFSFFSLGTCNVTTNPAACFNGPLLYADGGLTYNHGPAVIRAEYMQANLYRRGLGPGGTNLPGVVGKGYYASIGYMLTGEKRPPYSQATPKHPFLDQEGGFGAWEADFKYANLQLSAGNLAVPGPENRVDQFSWAINWYPTKLVKYTFDVDYDRLKSARSVFPAGQHWIVLLQRLQFKF